MKIKFNNNQLKYNGLYYNLGLSLLQEGYHKYPETNNIIFDITDNARFSVTDIIGFVNNSIEVTGYPTFIYADVSILDQEVYPELPARTIEDISGNTTTLKFSEWNNGGSQPIYTSVDGSKVILRTNISGSDLDGITIKKLAVRNIEVMGHKALSDKINSLEFNPEAIGKEYTVTSINDDWILDFNDFKQAREKMKNLVMVTGFNNLVIEEKRIAARWFAVPMSDIDSVLSFSEKLQASAFFNTQSIKSREKRLGACMLLGRNVLTFDDSNGILDDILKYDFINSYVTIGREGSEQMNVEGLPDPDGVIDYLLAKEGTVYETNGLLTKGYVPTNGMTLEQLGNTFVDILLNGNY